jgi:hypothetical protein
MRPRVSWRRRLLLVDGGQVARRGGDVLVAEQLLQARERATMGEVAQREAVAQGVRMREPRAITSPLRPTPGTPTPCSRLRSKRWSVRPGPATCSRRCCAAPRGFPRRAPSGGG